MQALCAQGRVMIWNSVPLMTAFDLLIIAVTIYGIWRCRLIGPSRRPLASRIGVRLIASGLLVVCVFYVADLVTMHVVRAVTSAQEEMALMDALHRNVSWPVALFAMIAISTGFVVLLTVLQEREARVRRLVDANIIGILIWDLEGRILEANDAFLRIAGYERKDLVSGGLRWPDLTPPEWHDLDARVVEELKMTGTAQPFEKEYFRKDGSRVPVLIGAASFEESGNEGVAFVLDLTERKQAEENLRESERRYHEVQMELAHANRVATMGQLSASIAHEVNQPITATVNNASAALRWLGKEPPELEKARQAPSRILATGNRASEVIGRMRVLLKKAPLRKEDVEINEAILEVIALTRGEVAKNGISMQTQLAERLPLIQGDRVQLQQVILNLIINAVEALSSVGEGPRELMISTGEAESEGVLVVVRDSGPGLPLASVERVFETFYTTKQGGLGLGLSICRSIIEAHGGQLWASANVPRGAIFQFTCPGS
jgi:PAS domain S-box-containing protein